VTPARHTPETIEGLRASLVRHALRLVTREGATGLTMRALAAEAGCAVGLPYKVFADRRDLIAEMLRMELARMRAAFDELIERAGTGTVGGNLAWLANVLLDSPAIALADEVAGDERLTESSHTEFHESGLDTAFDTVVPQYLAAEKRAGRVAPDVDEDAFGFVIVGAIHNLLVSGEAYPHPSRDELARRLAAVADRLADHPSPGRPGDRSPEKEDRA
jgi:AcrR family transcriptional regulator